jgi:hypothetical protein
MFSYRRTHCVFFDFAQQKCFVTCSNISISSVNNAVHTKRWMAYNFCLMSYLPRFNTYKKGNISSFLLFMVNDSNVLKGFHIVGHTASF